MARKQLKFGDDARQSLLRGIDIVAKAVVTTLGPKGRNIALDKTWGPPNIVHDGVSVAREIDLPDPFENMGAQLVKEAASKTNDVAGDGTTTATLLTQVITQMGMKGVTNGANPMIVKKGIEEAVKVIIEELKKIAKPIKGDREEITQVATISSGDPEIGKLIADAFETVGRNGIITVNEGKALQNEIEYKEGMEFDRGYLSQYFVTNPDKMECEIDDCYVLLTDKRISVIADLVPFLEKFVKVSRNLLIIAPDIEGQALATLVINKMKGAINVLAVKTPSYGDNSKLVLEDISILTGGTIVSDATGKKFDSIEVSELGQCDKVWSDKDNFRIIGGRGDKKSLDSRVKLINEQIVKTKSEFEKEKLEERLAKLTAGVAQINVGAPTEIEMNEKKERVKDAVGATKAAIEEGVLPGGAVALLRARKALKGCPADRIATEDELLGIKIIYDAMAEPLMWLAKNAGEDDKFVLREIENSKDPDFGYNCQTGEFGSMTKAGIFDPLKVTRSALQNAASVAMMVLTTEGLVTEIRDDKKDVTENIRV